MPADTGAESRIVQMRIRDANEDDLKAVVELWEMLVEHHRSYSDHFILARDGRRKWQKYLREKFDEISTKLIVAEEEGELVGFMLCLMSPQEPIFAEKVVGLISDAYVRKEWRNRGVTKEMLRVALRWFDKNKLKTVEISVAAANLEGRAAWAQLGFKPFVVRKRLDMQKSHAQRLMTGKSSKKIVRKKKGSARKT
jgi:L-amino acid N-acyltransferase YncA